MNKLTKWLEDQTLTTNAAEAIFILEDGRMVWGEFDLGMRGLDHNCIVSIAPDELGHYKKWQHIHETYNIVRMVPESQVAMILEEQPINDVQLAIIQELNYEIMEY